MNFRKTKREREKKLPHKIQDLFSIHNFVFCRIKIKSRSDFVAVFLLNKEIELKSERKDELLRIRGGKSQAGQTEERNKS